MKKKQNSPREMKYSFREKYKTSAREKNRKTCAWKKKTPGNKSEKHKTRIFTATLYFNVEKTLVDSIVNYLLLR